MLWKGVQWRSLLAAFPLLALLLLFSFPANADKPIDVRVLRVSGAGLSPDTAEMLTEVVLAKIAQNFKYRALPVPAEDPIDMMIDAGCIDFDAECLVKLAGGADMVLYTEVFERNGAQAINLRLVEVETLKVQNPEGEVQDQARVADFLSTALERILGPEPEKTPGPVRVDLLSTPPGGEVWIDGEFIGLTPVVTKLKPGTFKLRVAKAGFEEFKDSLVIEPGKAAQLNMALAAIEVPIADVAAAPAEKEPRKEVKTPVYKKWWFWTIIGAVVVGGATTAGVLAGQQSGTTGNSSASFSHDPFMAPQDVTIYPR